MDNKVMKRSVTLVLMFFTVILSFTAFAQKINITLPKEANKQYAFVLNKGLIRDTIQQGNIGFMGNVMVVIPEKHKDFVGMGVLSIKDGNALNLVVNRESFSASQNDAGKYIFTNSKENTYLYASIQNPQNPPAHDTTLYAPDFLDIITYMQQLNQLVQGQGDLMAKTNARLYALDQINYEALYTSGLWYYIIDGLLKLSPDQTIFGKDMVHILKRIKSQEVFEALGDNLVTITEQFGLDNAFDIIVPYLQESGRIETPQGKMYVAFTLIKVRKGLTAPSVEGLTESKDPSVTKMLLVFYDSGCHNCEEQMNLLIKEYARFKEQGVRVVALSSDGNEQVFKQKSATFPWVDTLCDYKGFAGPNFTKYGIMGTPTMFLIDKDMKVLGRYAKVEDIKFLNP